MEKLVVYTTTQTHSVGSKAGLILGLPVYAIPVRPEDDYSLRGQDLREAIENDKAEGRHPFVMSKTDPVFHPRRCSDIPQSAPSEPRRAARSTTSTRLLRHVSPGDLQPVFSLNVLASSSVRLPGYMVPRGCRLGRRGIFLPGV